jgi:hypothetical protein
VVYATAKGAAEWAELGRMSEVYLARRDAAFAALKAGVPAEPAS